MGIRTVMITGDNPLTAAAIADEAGVDDFLAEATPEDKMALIKREQEGGRLVAMTGDGTNDAPALAQADVGVAMNTGTQAAKEAGNMVDLDSNPTKLIEIVEIGKQLLITRGSLTTFSIANDVAKYFAIIPAMFVGAFPALDGSTSCDLEARESAILVGGHLQRAGHRRADPARAARREVPRRSARPRSCAATSSIYGVGGLIAPFIGIKLDRHRSSPGSGVVMMRRQLLPAICRCPRAHRARRPRLSARRHRRLAGRVRRHGERVAGRARRQGRRLALIGQKFTRAPARTSSRRPSAAGDGYDAMSSSASNLGPTNPTCSTRSASGSPPTRLERPRAGAAVPVDAVTASGSGLDPAHLARERRAPGAAGRRARAGSPLGEVHRARSTSTRTARRSGSSASRA